MDWLRTILWVSAGVAVAISGFAWWKAASVNEVLGEQLLSEIHPPTLAQVEEALAAEHGEGNPVKPFKLEPSGYGVGKKDGEYYAFDVLTDEKLPYPPTDADIRLLDLGKKMIFWSEMSRYGRIAAAVLLLGALALQFGFRAGI